MEENSEKLKGIKEVLESVMETCNFNTQNVIKSQESLLSVLRTLSDEINSLSSFSTIDKEKIVAAYFEKITSLKKRLHSINSKMLKIQGRVDKIEKKSFSVFS